MARGTLDADELARDIARAAGSADLQEGAGGGAVGLEDRALEAGRQQVGNAPHVVDVHMRDHQGLDARVGELAGQLIADAAGGTGDGGQGHEPH